MDSKNRIHWIARLVALAFLAAWTPLSQAQVVSSLGNGIYRIDLHEQARADALPSVSFADPLAREIGEPTDARPRAMPTLTMEGGHLVVTLAIAEGTSLYGTGEVPGQLLRNGRVSVNWNTDAYGYGLDAPSLYQSHPWVLGVRADGSAFGILADTTYRSTIDLRDGIRFEADGPAFPVIIIERDHPRQILSALAMLVGRMPMPPKWAIGYHQCRYSYEPASRVLEIAREFRERDIPCDVIWMDIDYMDGYRCFTFDSDKFPDPKALNDELHDMGFHTVWMIDPGIKKEEGYFVYDQGTRLDGWVKQADGTTPYVGRVWPGDCVFPDFTNERIRTWWGHLYKDFMATGIDGVWNDMNEPAVFGSATKTMPEENVHNADKSLGGTGSHARYHNIYGLQMIKATRAGVLAANPDKRPFVLSRASFIGGHRYGAAWTGDNVASWEHLEWSIPMVLNLGLSGQPFSGPDIGGFAGDGDGALYARWIGIGSLMPFSRGHTGKDNINKEPWSFGPEVEATARRALQRRSILIPHFYTLFWIASRSGVPIIQPLFFDDPTDPALRSEDDAFLLGPSILVKAAVTPDRDRVVAMPMGVWRRFDFRDQIPGDDTDPDLPELYLKAGSLIATGPIASHTGEQVLEPLTVYASPDPTTGLARGILYEDLGDGFAHREGQYRVTQYQVIAQGGWVHAAARVLEGDLPRVLRSLRVVVILDSGMYETIGLENEPIKVKISDMHKIE